MPLKGEEGSESKNKEVEVSNAGCDRVAVRVPSFWTNNAKLFFIQLEASFRLAGVIVEQTKFDYLVAALDPETLSHATDTVCEPPLHPYTALTSSLLTQFEVSHNKKLKTLIEDLESGDRSPSVLLRQMRDLGESHVDEAFLRNIWMRRLPSRVQAVLAVSSESLSNLAEMADKIIEFSPGAVNSVSDSAFASCYVHGIHRRDRIANDVHPDLVLKNGKIGNASTILGLTRKQNIAYRLVHLNKTKQNKRDSPAGVATASVLRGGSRKLYINDIKTHTGFLIDTGSDVSCYPKSFLTKEIKKSDFVLYAANGTRIATFGTKLLSLDLGLRRILQWPFIVADVTKPIIGADFLQHFGLSIDLKKRCLIDPLLNFSARGKSTVNDILVVKTIVGNSEYPELLRKFKEITHLNSSPKDTIKHDTVHYIPTVGPPVSARARWLNPAQLKIAKQEFQYMLEKGICRPSKSNSASPLYMVPASPLHIRLATYGRL
ncbi:hypothetical protein AVEN_46099-1 [Araneus ventricosus]|uniref:Peptidase A2 domain-containing protein n=1 Tax=Araneus ventricosus TaxID=182803 RepID=A0A4Y2HJ50_ARAVE|nr:hypothetical protein AVEN_46099-1 [Araneus ventricosus]